MLANISILSVSAALASLASAGRVIVANNCDYEVSVWAVGQVQSPVTHVGHGESFSEELHRDPVSGGRDIKIARKPHPGNTNPLSGAHLQLAYNVSPDGNRPLDTDSGSLNYDLNAIFNTPFPNSRVTLKSTGCPHILWETGVKPQNSGGQACKGIGHDLTLTLCAPAES
ncbi:blastomyces yeast-phase-specific protein [Hirsutella rhossiliensis]|uniref:Blastomyces yeast-phase-specific protein n=1 Tax=Hirsutella rhossiliensis TaxID=111463 RepID=A0A9P8N5S7_9HYPO|nr:uncharacterized protein HRG_00129 [Hirsutella rhossiliensis]KAH0967487.1 blastomyces yeast-phase-specific protein [Hirsutella rhossiliensis]